MNKTQLKVLWIGIGIFVLTILFPTLEGRGAINFSRLFIQWAIITVITSGLIYSLKVDPELILKMQCLCSYLSYFGKRPYREILEDARNKKTGTRLWIFWLVLVIVLLFVLIIAGSIPEHRSYIPPPMIRP